MTRLHRTGGDVPTRGRRATHSALPLKLHGDTHSRHSEQHIDDALENTFQASDPPATGGVTRIDPSKPGRKQSPIRCTHARAAPERALRRGTPLARSNAHLRIPKRKRT